MFLRDYDLVRVINLPSRADRKREIVDELARLVPSLPYEILPAFSPGSAGLFLSAGAHGCFLSHVAILEEAARHEKSVLIVEDDCSFTKDAGAYAFPDDCDVFYGGYEVGDELDLVNSDIIGSQLMGFSARAVQGAVAYLRGYLDADFKGDQRAVREPSYDPGVRPGIDGAYVWFRRANPQYKTVFAQPIIARQRSSRSDIAPLGFYDRVWPLRGLADLARRAKRQIAPH